jgi:hypothetical protein
MLELDHVVIAALDLDAGAAWLHERLGAPLAPGGRHVGWGTHNRLMRLGGGVYLELIAPDPSQPAPDAPRPFGLGDPAVRARLARSPALVHWLVRSTDLDADLAALRYDPGPARPMTRGALRWRITLRDDRAPPGGGLLPTVIAWDVPPDEHPAARLPEAGVRLEALSVAGPADLLALRPDVASPAPLDWTVAGAARLSLRLSAPAGRVAIDSAG